MKVSPEKAAGSLQHAGRAWYFCGLGCKAKFEANPGKYDGSAPLIAVLNPAPAAPAGQYTCPMHPEVVSSKPGACPKCGMALEPVTATASEENPELAGMTRRLWLSAALTLPL